MIYLTLNQFIFISVMMSWMSITYQILSPGSQKTNIDIVSLPLGLSPPFPDESSGLWNQPHGDQPSASTAVKCQNVPPEKSCWPQASLLMMIARTRSVWDSNEEQILHSPLEQRVGQRVQLVHLLLDLQIRALEKRKSTQEHVLCSVFRDEELRSRLIIWSYTQRGTLIGVIVHAVEMQWSHSGYE